MSVWTVKNVATPAPLSKKRNGAADSLFEAFGAIMTFKVVEKEAVKKKVEKLTPFF